jgi:hypothetical protein
MNIYIGTSRHSTFLVTIETGAERLKDLKGANDCNGDENVGLNNECSNVMRAYQRAQLSKFISLTGDDNDKSISQGKLLPRLLTLARI